jgi:hypothetical protein
MMIQGVVKVSSYAWSHKQEQVEVEVLSDDEDASFTRVKGFPGEETGLVLRAF